MRISEAKACIKELYKNTSEVTALIGERGVGKTSAYMCRGAEHQLYGPVCGGPGRA